jgi:low affinity Fe/Cu permease
MTTPSSTTPPVTEKHIAAHAAFVHVPRLVLSEYHRGSGLLDKIAAWVNAFVGSMWTFVAVTIGIVVWLFAGNIVGFDKTPWPLLLTLLNLPQLSIMISLQVSANLAQKTSDARALADHETLMALHELSKQQVVILEGQNQILELLKQKLDA